VIVTSGNHDSAARLGFQSALLRSGITVLTDPAAVGTPVTVDDADGPVHFYGIPYLEPAIVRHRWEGVELRSQAQTLGHVMGLVRDDLSKRGGRSVVISHCFAAGVEATPGVEREIRQGSLDVVPLSVFDGPDYVALGHIHGRQTLSDRVRYAGAPLHYSFGEGDKPRGSWLVDIDASGLASVTWLDLPVPRPLVTLRGTLDELLTDTRFDTHLDSWVCAQYTDATPQLDPMRRLQQRFTHCATVVHAPEGRSADDGRDYAGRVRRARNDVELIDAFLTHVRAGEGASAGEDELIRDVVDTRTLAEASA
jgi:exonuclease SbcD